MGRPGRKRGPIPRPPTLLSGLKKRAVGIPSVTFCSGPGPAASSEVARGGPGSAKTCGPGRGNPTNTRKWADPGRIRGPIRRYKRSKAIAWARGLGSYGRSSSFVSCETSEAIMAMHPTGGRRGGGGRGGGRGARGGRRGSRRPCPSGTRRVRGSCVSTRRTGQR